MITTPRNSDESSAVEGHPACACGPWWRLPLLLGLVLAAILYFAPGRIREDAGELENHAQREGSGAPNAEAAAAPVSLTIVFGDGREQILDAVDWREGMTVADVMQAAPRVSFLRQGSGESAFLTTIGDVTNEGAGGRNWIYSVNGERGDRSYAVYELQPGDRVLWTFAPPQ